MLILYPDPNPSIPSSLHLFQEHAAFFQLHSRGGAKLQQPVKGGEGGLAGGAKNCKDI